MNFDQLSFIPAHLIHKCYLMSLFRIFLAGWGKICCSSIWIHIGLKTLSVAAFHRFSHRSSLELSYDSSDGVSVSIKPCYFRLSNRVVKGYRNRIEVALLANAAPLDVICRHLVLLLIHLWVELPSVTILLFFDRSRLFSLVHFSGWDHVFIFRAKNLFDSTGATFFNNILHVPIFNLY